MMRDRDEDTLHELINARPDDLPKLLLTHMLGMRQQMLGMCKSVDFDEFVKCVEGYRRNNDQGRKQFRADVEGRFEEIKTILEGQDEAFQKFTCKLAQRIGLMILAAIPIFAGVLGIAKNLGWI